MSGITSHILDTSRGRPAAGVVISLARHGEGGFVEVARASTNADGRVGNLAATALLPGMYRLTFETRAYFMRLGVATFYPEVIVTFEVGNASEHYHVPLLINPFGYSTYRGS